MKDKWIKFAYQVQNGLNSDINNNIVILNEAIYQDNLVL